jgi:hypothetical protein
LRGIRSRQDRRCCQAMSAAEIERRLTPGAGKRMFFEFGRSRCGELSRERWGLYSLVSIISSAIRARALDQSRSAVRSETSSASAVSEVVRPAK